MQDRAARDRAAAESAREALAKRQAEAAAEARLRKAATVNMVKVLVTVRGKKFQLDVEDVSAVTVRRDAVVACLRVLLPAPHNNACCTCLCTVCVGATVIADGQPRQAAGLPQGAPD